MNQKRTKTDPQARATPTSKRKILAGRRKTTKSTANQDFVVVGIGASAGGLEALRSLILHLPPLDNVVCVVAQHLDPKHRSVLGELLARDTALEVVEVKHNDWLRPKTIYITPYDRHIAIANGRFKLSKPTTSFGPKPSVDYFFTSLANEKGEKAVGIILSGTGSDGAHGIRAIKAEGGITIVQDVKTAKYNGMPQAAIDTGLVDLILPPEKMGPALPTIVAFPKLGRKAVSAGDAGFNIQTIVAMLQERLGYDFSEYKSTTINRRIERRMALRKIGSLKEYIRYLSATPDELDNLRKDILITVTSFFRDRAAFDALSSCITKIVETKKPRDSIRFWVAGCATGEEAYSIAILLAEALPDQFDERNIQIFATDLDDAAIEMARRGTYLEATVVDIDKSILDRYFTSGDHTFQVSKSIRDKLIFAQQNLVSDPPFSGLDLVVCRNVLIYFSSRLQNRLLSMFHYVLNDTGYLLLGKSESVGELSSLFSQVDRKWKIYKRTETFRTQRVDLGIGQMGQYRPIPYKTPVSPKKEIHLQELTNRAIADCYGPKAVVVDDHSKIVFVRGDVSPYLRLPGGKADLDVVDMMQSEFRMELRSLMHRAIREQIPVRGKQHQFTDDGTAKLFRLMVTPLLSADDTQLILVAFEEQSIETPKDMVSEAEGGDVDPHVQELEQELGTTREYLQTTVEELETTNEELQATNEELQSTNEELHSSNEELQTASEELQSTNEELSTVNQELQIRSSELVAAHTEIDNILNSVGFAMLVVDNHLRVRRFTSDAAKIFALSGISVDSVLTSLTSQNHLPDLGQEVVTVIERATVSQKEITTGQNTYWLTIAPFFSHKKIAVGAILTFFDRTEQKRMEESLQENAERFRALTEHAPVCVHEIDLQGRLLTMNAAGLRMMGIKKEEEITGSAYIDIVCPEDRERVAALLKRAYEGCASEFEYTAICNGQQRVFASSFVPLRNADESVVRLMGHTQDISERRQADKALQSSEQSLVEAQRIARMGSWEWDLVNDKMHWSDELYRVFGVTRDQFVPSFESFLELVHLDDRESIKEHVEATCSQGSPFGVDYRITLPDGAIRFMHAEAELECDGDGQPLRLMGTAQDISEAHDLSEQLSFQASHDVLTGLINRREFEHRLARALETARSDNIEHALCYFDLDQFKVVNDSCGHVAGDELLRQLAALLTQRIRKRDTLARLGGDEFAVLMERCSLTQAKRVANGLRKAIEGFQFLWKDKSFSIGVSIGLVLINKDSQSAINALKDADSACYAAKDAGRNRIHVYHEADAQLAKRHGEMQLATRIEQNLEHDRFHLDIQPIVPVTSTGVETGFYELLLRMEDKEGDIVPPDVFFSAAERYNLSTKLDRWVIGTAFSWLASHPENLERLLLFSLNLSGHSLGDEEFLQFVMRQFKEKEIPPQKICFEVTETAAIANLAMATRFINVLKRRGCMFALDDFGSGLSSFAYLKNLDVDFLKIDGVFVKHILDDPIDLAMVKSINDIGHVMGKKTIAEFAENEAVLKKLREIGVDYAQGYAVGRPQPLTQML